MPRDFDQTLIINYQDENKSRDNNVVLYTDLWGMCPLKLYPTFNFSLHKMNNLCVYSLKSKASMEGPLSPTQQWPDYT